VTTVVPLTERDNPLGWEANVTLTVVPGGGDAEPPIGPTDPSEVVAEKE